MKIDWERVLVPQLPTFRGPRADYTPSRRARFRRLLYRYAFIVNEFCWLGSIMMVFIAPLNIVLLFLFGTWLFSHGTVLLLAGLDEIRSGDYDQYVTERKDKRRQGRRRRRGR